MVGNYPMVVGDDGLYRNLQDFKKNGNEQSVSEKSLTRVWCVNTASASHHVIAILVNVRDQAA